MVVVRVEHLGDRLSRGSRTHRVDIVAPVERLHVEPRALGLPKTQNRHALALEAGDVHIIRNRVDRLVIHMVDRVVAILPALLDPAPEMYRDRTVGFAGQPDRTARQPVVRGFGLPAVDDPLLEDAEFVEERIPHCREVLGGHRVEVAGCKPPQAAVAKAGVRLQLEDLRDVHVELLERFGHFILNAEVVKAVFERASHQELHAHIIDLLGGDRVGVRVKYLIPFGENPTDHPADRFIIGVIRSELRFNEHFILDRVKNQLFQSGSAVLVFRFHFGSLLSVRGFRLHKIRQ